MVSYQIFQTGQSWLLLYGLGLWPNYNARSDWLRAISERSLWSRNAHGPITDYAN